MTIQDPVRVPFDNSYARLPQGFFARVDPTPVAAPRLIAVNERLAEMMGLDPSVLASPEGVAMLAGQRVAEGSEPIATAYAGHQFGSFVPQLGDGRAILLGEVVGRDGVRRDVQLKGAGPTPFSRNGDGRAALGPVLREYCVSEAMAALGIPTTRALAVVATGEPVFRETVLPGAVLTRVATSHIRVGTFQFFAARRNHEALRRLADVAIARHDPAAAEAPQPYVALLEGVIQRQASLIARWMLVGFIHGVMNTDNMSISGETIDYGPCAFMDRYDPTTVFSSIDYAARYAYANQPLIAQWNLARLAEAMLPLLGDSEEAALEAARAAVASFPGHFEPLFRDGLRRKLGLQSSQDDDVRLMDDLLNRMEAGGADHTLTFRRLAAAAADPAANGHVAALFSDPQALAPWLASWRARLGAEGGDPSARAAAMRRVSPAVIPRNHKVEAMIAAALRDDFAPFHALNAALAHPYDEPADPADAEPPSAPAEPYRTFCGT